MAEYDLTYTCIYTACSCIIKLTDKHSDQFKLGQELTAKFPRMYKFWLGPFNATVVLNHPETIKQILKHAGMLIFIFIWYILKMKSYSIKGKPTFNIIDNIFID